MEEQRKHAILFAATLLCARKVIDRIWVRQANHGETDLRWTTSRPVYSADRERLLLRVHLAQSF